MADNKNVYEIGLAMAGAISAGAYSAGVVDFLFQALHEWELAKHDNRKDSVPNHSVCVRAVKHVHDGVCRKAQHCTGSIHQVDSDGGAG